MSSIVRTKPESHMCYTIATLPQSHMFCTIAMLTTQYITMLATTFAVLYIDNCSAFDSLYVRSDHECLASRANIVRGLGKPKAVVRVGGK